jgi:uncharacterized protein YjeT (DUF2065 family)
MIPIKLQCGCGQRYAFDVEPVNGRMGVPVACPVCGADGTGAANEVIAQSLVATAAAAPPPRAPVRIAGPPPGAHLAAPAAPTVAAAPRRGPLPGQLDRTSAENEAHAKILWGDSPEEVVKFLTRQGLNAQEAQELVAPWFRERTRTIRRNGITKVVVGTVMLCAPVVFLIVSLMAGSLLLMPFAVTIMVGFWGLCKILKGIFMFFAPKSERGDVAEQ